MGDEWAVNEEGLMAMDAATKAMDETTEKIQQDIKQLESAFEENEAGLGAHSDEIRTLIEELQAVGQEASNPVKKLILKMMKSMLIRQKHIEESSYTKGRSR